MAVGLQRSGDWLAARRSDQCAAPPANHRCAVKVPVVTAGGVVVTDVTVVGTGVLTVVGDSVVNVVGVVVVSVQNTKSHAITEQ